MDHHGFDIRGHAFTRTVRGFDEAEVEAALVSVAPVYEEARATLQELQKALAETLAERDQLLEGERSVIKLIRTAEEHARMRIGGAHRDAARIVERAEEQARELLAEMEAHRTRLLLEAEGVERRRDHLVATVSNFVETMAVKPSAAFVPDALATLSRTTTDPAWVPLAEQEQEDLATALSWSDEIEGTVVEEAAIDAAGAYEHAGDPAPIPDVEPAPEDGAAWSIDGDAGPVRWWARLNTRHALAATAAVAVLAIAIALPAVRQWGTAPPRGTHSAVGTSPVLAASFVPDPAAPSPAPGPGSSSALPDPPPAAPLHAATSSAPLAIKLTSTRSCWVGVTVDGQSDSVLLGPGDELERSGSKQIRLRIGDAAAATVVVNGLTLPPLGKSGEVIDRTFSAEDYVQ